MKKFSMCFILTLLLAFSSNAQSRLAEGNTFIGGALRVSSNYTYFGESANQSHFSYQATPTLGHFMSDKIVIGGSVGMTGYRFGDEMIHSLIISPFVRNYFTTTERVGLYGAISLPVTLIDDERAGLGISAGVTFFATEKIALEARTNLLSFSVPFRDGGINYGVGLSTNAVGLGFLFFL